MTLRTGMNAPAVLIDKYINSAYDIVKSVSDNLSTIIDISNLVGAYIVAADTPTVRVDGTALREGDRWYSTETDLTYAWDGDSWKAIGTNNTVVETQFATASQATFTLANVYAPNSNNILVFVDGVYQLSKSISAAYGAYTESGTNTIVFDTALPLNTQVTFVIGTVITDATSSLSIIKKLYTAVGGETLVTIPDSLSYVMGNNSLSVSINGLEQSLVEAAYAESTITQVTFSEALTVGDSVLFTKFTIT
jgi:hypothetical protein